jgi:iron(III) transport system substrate-binding protein
MVQRSWLIVLAAALAAPPAFGAAPQTAEEIANYTGSDRAQIIEAGTRKEGALLLYTGATSKVVDEFRKRYPYLKVETAQSDAPQHVRRMSEEYKAGRYIVDVVATSNQGLISLKNQGLIQPYKSPEMAAYRSEALEPSGYWALAFESFVSLGYNTKAIAEAEVPKTLDDLTNPKWMNKIAFANTTIPNWIGAVYHDLGDKGAEAYLEKLAKNKATIYQLSGRAMANLVVSGEVPMSPSAFSSHMADSAREGASVAWRPLGGVYANVSSVALAKRPVHPHAAMTYIDFILSKEGQLLHREAGYSSGRKDMETRETPSKRYYLGEEEGYEANFEKWGNIGRKYFGAAAKK